MHMFPMLMESHQEYSLTSVNIRPKYAHGKTFILHNKNNGLKGNCSKPFTRSVIKGPKENLKLKGVHYRYTPEAVNFVL